CSPNVSEQDLYRSIQTVLSCFCSWCMCAPLCSGMLRWTLHKKVQNNPGNSLTLVWVLMKELEKVLDLNTIWRRGKGTQGEAITHT
uniref:Uncharacterized protein n=1 Tax=Mola mola TaxID=94237 RepID=A0A3Q3W563_MOLML